ncbi:MAG: WecB/TagA/CpsF family glycosyltransferase [Candidatus Sedimenticola sp. (ex Thyasira tokunagai)]
MDDFDRNVWCILGLPFDAVTIEDAVVRVRRSARNSCPCFISTPNVNFLIASQSEYDFRYSVINSDLVLADGMPIVWIAKLLRLPVTQRVPGSGLIERLWSETASKYDPIKVFFFGGEKGVAETACEIMGKEKRGLECAGHYYPGFGSVEDMSSDSVIDAINKADPDFTIVSLGARKGQAWIQLNKDKLHSPVISHLGAVVNFVAGTVKRAPVLVQKFGLEWLWRIKEEPALWRRYLFDGLLLAKLIITKVLPYSVLAWRWKRGICNSEPAVTELTESRESITIFLNGALLSSTLGPLRSCFRDSVSSQKDVILDFSRVNYIDSAAIGLLYMLKKNLMINEKEMIIRSVSKRVSTILSFNCASHLLTDD